jgi:hypothetical protein
MSPCYAAMLFLTPQICYNMFTFQVNKCIEIVTMVPYFLGFDVNFIECIIDRFHQNETEIILYIRKMYDNISNCKYRVIINDCPIAVDVENPHKF